MIIQDSRRKIHNFALLLNTSHNLAFPHSVLYSISEIFILPTCFVSECLLLSLYISQMLINLLVLLCAQIIFSRLSLHAHNFKYHLYIVVSRVHI